MKINWKNAVARAVRRYRADYDLSQEEFAERVDMSRGYISRVESEDAQISLSAFLVICDGLERQPWDLLKDAAENPLRPAKSAPLAGKRSKRSPEKKGHTR